MIKLKLIIYTFLGLITCHSPINKKTIHKSQIENTVIDFKVLNDSTLDVQIQIDQRVLDFVKNLKHGEKLGPFFVENWILVYHEDNRCDGSTDGQIGNLTSTKIDSAIKLQVKNDGDGWACDKKAPKTYDMDFDLKKKIAGWDRFEIPDYENEEKNIVYVVGAGESDYLKLHYNDDNLIFKLEYRSEDPG
ncbi:hypothetical protein [Maribacter sp. 2210JD10-5]|uniref:hypothetical protein n=1 Tax=Maribacter sp. 2210JD10-5 TaxID=3386272 RepID=UPI0039BD5A1E